MSKNNIRYSEYTHIWYYSGIQLLFFSNWSILFLHGNNCVRMSETQKCVSEQLPYMLTENFFLHSILSKPLQHQGPGTNKNLVVLLVQFQVHTELKHKKSNVFKKCLFRPTILQFFLRFISWWYKIRLYYHQYQRPMSGNILGKNKK